MSHAAISTLCRSIKLQCELYSSRQIAICLDPYCGLGFVLWCLSRYTHTHTQNTLLCHLKYLLWMVPPVLQLVCIFLLFVSVFTQVTSLSLSLRWSWRPRCLCGWARSVSTRSETPSAPTPSWSCAPKASARRARCWRSVWRSTWATEDAFTDVFTVRF